MGKWCRKKRDAFLPPELTVWWSNHEYGTLEEEKVSSYWGLPRTCWPVGSSVGQCLECLNRQKKTAWKWTATSPGLGDLYKQEQNRQLSTKHACLCLTSPECGHECGVTSCFKLLFPWTPDHDEPVTHNCEIKKNNSSQRYYFQGSGSHFQHVIDSSSGLILTTVRNGDRWETARFMVYRRFSWRFTVHSLQRWCWLLGQSLAFATITWMTRIPQRSMLGKQRLGASTYDIYWVLAQKELYKKKIKKLIFFWRIILEYIYLTVAKIHKEFLQLNNKGKGIFFQFCNRVFYSWR